MTHKEINFLKSDVKFKEAKNYKNIYFILAVLFVFLLILLPYHFYKKTEKVGQQVCEDRGLNYSKTILKEGNFVIECYDLHSITQIKLNDWKEYSQR